MKDNNLSANKTLGPELNNRNIPFSTISSGFMLFGLFLLVSLTVSLPLVIIQTWVNPVNKSLFNFIGYAGSMILLLIITVKIRKSFSFPWNKANVLVFILSVIVVLSMSILIEPVTSLIPMPEWFEKMFKDVVSRDIFSFLMVVIVAPILEEIVFRGVLLEGLLKRYSPVLAIFWSSFIFGIIHLNPWQFIGAFLIGIVLGWVYWKTNSLWPCIIMHLANNLLGFIFFVYSDTSQITFKILIGDRIFGLIYFLCIPLFVLGIFTLKWVLNRKV